MTGCECPSHGMCKRHGVFKTKHWHDLCQNHDKYFLAWEEGRGPGQSLEDKERVVKLTKDNANQAWLALHRYAVENANNWNSRNAKLFYRHWLATVPSYGCPCKSNWSRYTKENKPDYNSAKGFFEWSVRAHNHVSTHHAEPRKPAITLSEAAAIHGAPWSCV